MRTPFSSGHGFSRAITEAGSTRLQPLRAFFLSSHTNSEDRSLQLLSGPLVSGGPGASTERTAHCSKRYLIRYILTRLTIHATVHRDTSRSHSPSAASISNCPAGELASRFDTPAKCPLRSSTRLTILQIRRAIEGAIDTSVRSSSLRTICSDVSPLHPANVLTSLESALTEKRP